MKYYLICCKSFSSLLAFDLSEEEISHLKVLYSKLSFDEYAGYSPDQQAIRKEMERYVKVIGKLLPYENI